MRLGFGASPQKNALGLLLKVIKLTEFLRMTCNGMQLALLMAMSWQLTHDEKNYP